MPKHVLALLVALMVLLPVRTGEFLALTTAPAAACGLDGVPSLMVNGHLVMANPALPTSAHVATWAPFLAPGSYRPGQVLQLAEIRGRVLWTLPPSALRTPWRWTFGDGTAARGLRVRHTYRRRGVYVVRVRAYLRDGHDAQWYPFDTAVIHVG